MAADRVLRLLVVDDEPILLEVMQRMLSSAGHHVSVANSAMEAIEVAGGCGCPLDLVITDVQMPRMTGPALASVLRQVQPRLPILFVSAWRESDTDPLPGPLLQKPFGFEDLLAAVIALTSERPALTDGRV